MPRKAAVRAVERQRGTRQQGPADFARHVVEARFDPSSLEMVGIL